MCVCLLKFCALSLSLSLSLEVDKETFKTACESIALSTTLKDLFISRHSFNHESYMTLFGALLRNRSIERLSIYFWSRKLFSFCHVHGPYHGRC